MADEFKSEVFLISKMKKNIETLEKIKRLNLIEIEKINQ